MLIFSTTQDRTSLAIAETIFCDGTFYAYPYLYHQLDTTYAMVDGSMYPLISALLPRKDQVIYTRFFRQIRHSTKIQYLLTMRQQPTTQRALSFQGLLSKPASSTSHDAFSERPRDEDLKLNTRRTTKSRAYTKSNSYITSTTTLGCRRVAQRLKRNWQRTRHIIHRILHRVSASYGTTTWPKDPAPPTTLKNGTRRLRRKYIMPTQTSTRSYKYYRRPKQWQNVPSPST